MVPEGPCRASLGPGGGQEEFRRERLGSRRVQEWQAGVLEALEGPGGPARVQ